MTLGASLLAAHHGVTQPAPETEASVGRALLAIDTTADGGSAPGRDGQALGPADLALILDGSAWPIAAVEKQTSAPLVILFDTSTLSAANLRLAALDLSQRAEALTALGPVELVVAGDRRTRRSLPPSTDATAVSEALSWTAVRERSAHRSELARAGFVEDLGSIPSDPRDPSSVARAGLALRKALAEEARALSEGREAILAWLAANRAAPPGVLLLVSDGVDSDPALFYRGLLEERGFDALGSELDRLTVLYSNDDVGRAAAIYGWTILPYLARDLDWSGELVLEPSAPTEAPDPGRSPTADLSAPGQALRLDRLFGRRQGGEEESEEGSWLVDPESTLVELARATGGETIASGVGLESVLERLSRRAIAAVDLSRVPPGRALPVELSASEVPETGGAAPLRAPRWLARGTPEVISELRLRRSLEGDLADDRLIVSAALRPADAGGRQGELALRLISPQGGAAPEGPLRISVLVADSSGGDRVIHRPLSAADRDAGKGDLASLTTPLSDGLDTRVGVVVEDMTSGVWGGTVAAAIESDERVAADSDDDWLLPAPKVVNLLLPEEPILMGETRFETIVSDRDVDRVDFLVDGVLEVSVRAPFAALLDLGRLPEPREIEVLAFDAVGRELGRDRMIVNEGTSGFRVRISGPEEPSSTPGERTPLTGPVDIDAQVRFPRDAKLDRIEYFWNQEMVATRYGPPFRQQIVIPDEAPAGYVRVVAYLADGSSSEDVLLLNTPGTSERVDVDLVELYVVVSDRKGRPVLGLEESAFQVLEDGEPQPIATFSDAESLPLTVGLAIDSSASMFVKLPSVRRAATTFFEGLSTPQDRAFIVGFGDEPVLAQSATSDRARMESGLGTLRPDGHTGLWRATVFSLVQLQGVRGKKALIVFTDGADEDKDFSFRTCYKFAQRVGVPVYYILSNDEIVRTGGKGLSVRPFLNRLERLARATGGA